MSNKNEEVSKKTISKEVVDNFMKNYDNINVFDAAVNIAEDAKMFQTMMDEYDNEIYQIKKIIVNRFALIQILINLANNAIENPDNYDDPDEYINGIINSINESFDDNEEDFDKIDILEQSKSFCYAVLQKFEANKAIEKAAKNKVDEIIADSKIGYPYLEEKAKLKEKENNESVNL